MAKHFVLDQNFPWHASAIQWPPTVLRISRLRDADPDLVEDVDDWQIFQTLDRRGDVDGFITNDAKLLNLPTEMVVLFRSRLTLVVTDGTGGDAVRATGLVMVHLLEIAKRTSGKPQIYILRPGRLQPVSPGVQINVLAERAKIPPNHLISRELTKIGLTSESTEGD